MKCHRSPIGTCIWAFFTPSYPAQLTSRCDRDSLRVLGIENNNVRNPKDLRGMARNAKSMKRNNEAWKGILIAPSKLPRYSFGLETLTVSLFIHYLQQMPASGPRSAARMATRQTPHLKLVNLL